MKAILNGRYISDVIIVLGPFYLYNRDFTKWHIISDTVLSVWNTAFIRLSCIKAVFDLNMNLHLDLVLDNCRQHA